MEVFTGLKSSRLIIRPMPLQNYKNLEALNEACKKELIYVIELQEALGQVHNDVVKSNAMPRTHVQKIHIARTNVLPLNITVGD